MGKKIKKKGPSWPFVKLTVIAVIMLAGTGLICYGGMRFINKSRYFAVKTIVLSPSLTFIDKQDLAGIKGKNIFSVNLEKVHKRLILKYPQVTDLRIIRRFPNEIYITAQNREPFIQTKIQNKILTLDDKGVILSNKTSLDKDLPYITGLSAKNSSNPGLPLRGADLYSVLEIVRSYNDQANLKKIPIRTIDVANFSKIIFQLSNNIDVIMDKDKIEHDVRVLDILLSQGKVELGEVAYIDLRFKEPIIGKK